MKSKRKYVLFGLGSLIVISIFIVWTVMENRQPKLQEPSDVPLDPQSIAYEELKSASRRLPQLSVENGFPRGVLVDIAVPGNSAVERAQKFLEIYTDLYRQNDPALALAVRRTGESFGEHVTFYQTYKDLPVYAAEIVVSLDGENVFSSVGGLLIAGLDIDINPGLSNRVAEDIVRSDLKLPEAPIFGQTTLLVFDRSLIDDVDPDPRLAWRVSAGDRESWTAFVDAQSGEVIFKYERTQSGTGGYDLDLEDANGTNAQDTGCFWQTTADDQIGDEDELYAEGQVDPEGAALWSYAKSAYLFYHNTFGYHSYDNNDGQFELYIHAPNVGKAQWVSGNTDCDLIQFSPGWVGYDILVHELAHAVITFSSGLYYHGQSGALNESFADVMGAVADGNWTMGEGRIGGGGAIRSLSHPPTFGHPDHMTGYVWTSGDHGGVHSNSGIPNKAAYLLAVGRSGNPNQVTVNGIGTSNMGQLYFNVMRFLPTYANFTDARNLSIAFAGSMFNPSAVCDVRNAFFYVGIGEADIDCDGIEDGGDGDGDGVPGDFDNCHGIFNPDQVDVDEDGWGRACDPDDNGNQQPDTLDTAFANPYMMCPTPLVPCDTDNYDGDAYPNAEDNCPYIANDDQLDTDQDGEGDACDADTDLDGWSNNNDNCPWTPNADQANADGDFAGDACDAYPDCPDVYAWTTGTMIGDLKIPPQPIQDPLACAREISIDRAEWQIEKKRILDSEPLRVDLTRGESLYTLLPIPPCPPGDPLRYSPEYRGHLNLAGLPAEIRPWVADDRGFAVSSKQGEPGDLELQFLPQGGRSYFLTLADFREPGQMDSFSLSMRCGLREPVPHSETESTPTAEPTSTMTPEPTLTPTSTPTEAPVVEGPSDPIFSTDTFYYRSTSCGRKEVTIQVGVEDPNVYSVVLFFRLKDVASGETTAWTNVPMAPMGGGQFSRTVHSETDIPDFARFTKASFQVQIVATASDGTEIGRTGVFSEVILEVCSAAGG
ncbi:MAG: hypothetical protein E3J69_09725 [Anaerolineales bacterium]|nr:MAG: hypothetical protein E3J69_09725 [Anaerolineales bacterium]